MTDPETPGIQAGVAVLREALRTGALAQERLKVAVICGYPPARGLWAALGNAMARRPAEMRATRLTRQFVALSPAWGMAAAREALRVVLRWLTPSHASMGRGLATATLDALEAPDDSFAKLEDAWHLYAYSVGSPHWPLEKAAVLLRQATDEPTADRLIECVTLCLQGLKEAGFPVLDQRHSDIEVGWAMAEGLTVAALGHPPAPWRRLRRRADRWRIWEEEGSSHGDLYELEQTTYFRVLDWLTKSVVYTYTGEMSASYDGVGWSGRTHGGVRAIDVTPAGQLQVHDWSGAVTTVDPRRLAPAPEW